MLEEIALESLVQIRARNQPIFDTEVNFDDLVKRRQEIVDKYAALSSVEKSKYKDISDFERAEGAPNLKSPALLPAKNLSLVRREVQERLNSMEVFRLLPIDALDFEESLLELAESIENVEYIRELYRIRKRTSGPTKNAGISKDEAVKLKNCFSQGRELFLSGRNGSLMVKPLNFFYALTAYSYGAIILNNPLRYRKDMLPGSHGMAYLPDPIQAQFGGDSPHGTFSDLVTAFPVQLIKKPGLEFGIDCTNSVIEFYENRFSVGLGTLLSMVPEMHDYFKLTTGRNSRCFPLEIITSSDLRRPTWEFHIGDGETRPSGEMIAQAFDGFVRSERHGKTILTVPVSEASKIKACIYSDIRGQLWFIENPFFPVILPEIAVHFLISSVFSNIMRYRPDEWGNVLLNEVSSDISLLTRHYFSSFQRKFLVIVLREITKFLPYAS